MIKERLKQKLSNTNLGKDITKLTTALASGNYVQAAFTVLKSKKLRKYVIIASISSTLFSTLPLVALSGAMFSAILSRPMEDFKPDEVTQIKNQANAWESTIKWISGYDKKGNPIWTTGLDDHQIQQVNDEGVNLSWGLVAALKEFGAKDTAKTAKSLSPTEIEFEKVAKVTNTYEYDPQKGRWVLISSSSNDHWLLSKIVTYNGTHNFKIQSYSTVTYQMASNSNASTPIGAVGTIAANTINGVQVSLKTVVTDEKIDGDNWKKDYSPLYAVEKPIGITKDLEDQSLLFRQAMLLDSSFGDPLANPVLNEMIGGIGDSDTSSDIPTGGPLPPTEITEALKQAIKITGVKESEWLPGLQRLVMIESGGNPRAVAKKTAWYSAAWGYQRAEGLLQTMPPTFFEYALPDYRNIWNPVDNAVASIRYIQADYGSVGKALANESKGGY